MKSKNPYIPHGKGYAYVIGKRARAICNWAEASEEQLAKGSQKPSPEAEVIKVAIISLAEFRALRRLARSAGTP